MVPFETVSFVRISISEVIQTFLEALALVVIVVYIFLQSWRATLIPILVIPVSLIGTFIFFQLLGFSINTLTLFGFVLAIGIVVDDAIVVVEAVQHHIDANGMSPRDATFKAMEEVSAPVIAIGLILAAVFVPVAFIPGVSGKLYQQFALTIAFSVILSAFLALSLTPALCSVMMRPSNLNAESKGLGKLHYKFNTWFEKFTARYTWRSPGDQADRPRIDTDGHPVRCGIPVVQTRAVYLRAPGRHGRHVPGARPAGRIFFHADARTGRARKPDPGRGPRHPALHGGDGH